MARQNDEEVTMLSALLSSKRIHVDHVFENIRRQGGRSVDLIRPSFNCGAGYLRESPMVELVERKVEKAWI